MMANTFLKPLPSCALLLGLFCQSEAQALGFARR